MSKRTFYIYIYIYICTKVLLSYFYKTYVPISNTYHIIFHLSSIFKAKTFLRNNKYNAYKCRLFVAAMRRWRV